MIALERDMTAYADAVACRRLAEIAGLSVAPADPSLSAGKLRERLEDHLRPSRVAGLFDDARRAPETASGESARRRHRAVCRAYLERACREPDEEIASRTARFDLPAGGFEPALACAEDPAERRRLFGRWIALEEELAEARVARHEARLEACRTLGAESVTDYLAAEQAPPAVRLAESFRGGAIEPLDDVVGEATRRRWVAARSFPCLPVESVLRSLGREIGADPDGGRTRLVRPTGTGGWPELFAMQEPVLVLGGPAGPLGLARSVACLGRAARSSFLRERRGALAPWVDPAFDHGAEVLFSRLLLSREFALWAGIEGFDSWIAPLRLEVALAPRLAWAYLCLAVDRPGRGDALPDASRVEEVVRRAVNRPATPADRTVVMEADPRPEAVLRGTVYGLLLEERLLTRFGYDWFTERGAVQMLRESWEAEPEETAESMADALGLGTIEPTPILDGCRP